MDFFSYLKKILISIIILLSCNWKQLFPHMNGSVLLSRSWNVHCCSLGRLDMDQATFPKYIIFFHCGKGRGAQAMWDGMSVINVNRKHCLSCRTGVQGTGDWKCWLTCPWWKMQLLPKQNFPGKASCHYVRKITRQNKAAEASRW